VTAAVLALSAPAIAAAHSLLLESTPAAGATLSEAPPRISLRFNNRIEKSLSSIRVLDDRGAPQPVTVLAAEGAADRLIATVATLAPGAWRIEWRVLSTDGHIVNGRFSFRVVSPSPR